MKTFHAHVYFTVESRPVAAALHARIAGAGLPLLYFGRLIDRPIGPHPLPMFEIDFTDCVADQFEKLLNEHRSGLSVLIHEVTGRDTRDHSEGARWLGEKITLDDSVFKT
jgi:DOPA 4,5-dioxygenase